MMPANRLYAMDAIEGLKQLDADSIDLIVTDPPYNIASKNKTTLQRGRIVSTMEAWGEWDSMHPFDYDMLIGTVLAQCWRVLKPGGALYMFTSTEDNGFFIRYALRRGFVLRSQLAMIKKSPLPSLSKSNWRRAFELCLFVTKGKPKTFNFLSQQELVNLYHYATSERETRHPTEKPLGLIERIIAVSSDEGDLILDPFAGSGTTLVAAANQGRRWLGFERNEEYVEMARSRLQRAGER